MSVHDRIRNLEQQVELLAPAGRWEALEAVLAAGADSVYLSPKRFNMRRHRSDFHFSAAQIAAAAALAHEQGRRVYVTVNALLGESELTEVRDLLLALDGLGVDAIIVCDLATVRLAAELRLKVPLHASTMMNVHHEEHARALKALGVTRIIPSRDISVEAIGEIARLADIEVECFIHGDMCVAQSGQCSISGVLFGKSANRGECMKPCRWEYDLVRLDDGEAVGQSAGGHLLAIKDLCMIRHVPELVRAGICSLKIEGRMRDSPYLAHLVRSYREAVDAYYACPPNFRLSVETIERTYQQQVRALSTLTMLGGSSHRDYFDTSGRREPLFLSDGHTERAMAEEDLPANERARGTETSALTRRVELAVCVADGAAAAAALEAGADRIYIAAEVSQHDMSSWTPASLVEAMQSAHERGAAAGLRTPRVTTAREWSETRWILERLAGKGLRHVLVHHPGTLMMAKEVCPQASIIADFGFNLLNSAAVALLADLGVEQATVSNEAGYEDLAALAGRSTLPLEILAHGPVSGMLLDHCMIALHATPQGRKDNCRGPCRHVEFGLRDRTGEVRTIVADQYCRNHLLTAHDLAILPRLERFLLPLRAVSSLRVEGQFYSAACVEAVTRAYRLRLDALTGAGDSQAWQPAWQEAVRVSPRPLNLGPYARSIIDSPSTTKVMRKLAPMKPRGAAESGSHRAEVSRTPPRVLALEVIHE